LGLKEFPSASVGAESFFVSGIQSNVFPLERVPIGFLRIAPLKGFLAGWLH
jgi:hypothetical protein